MRLVILYRDSQSYQEDFLEKEAATKAGFIVLSNLSQVQKSDLIIGRYSLWPFYTWVNGAIEGFGAKLINSNFQYDYISNLENYVSDLGNLTSETWVDGDGSFNAFAPEQKYIVKGQTNSRKFQWSEMMFANNKKEALRIARDLSHDSLIKDQKIFFRKFENLKTFIQSNYNNPPITEEYRFFICYGKIVSGAFYWSNYYDELSKIYNLDASNVPTEFLYNIIEKINNKSNFYCIDVARKENGSWIVIELNEGQQSGLSMNDPNILYSNLFNTLKEKYL